MDERFELVSQQKMDYCVETFLLRDKQTGVLYLFTARGSSGGLTCLIDKDGKPLTSYRVEI